MKVKFFNTTDGTEGWEEEINNFIKDKKVYDMKLVSQHSDEWGNSYDLLIMYE